VIIIVIIMDTIKAKTTEKLMVATSAVMNNDQIWMLFGSVGVATIVSQVIVSSFRSDVYEPFTDYLFPGLFESWVISSPGKRDIKIGQFLRKIVLWLVLTFVIILIF
jgi:hypothetical protein